MGLIKGLARLSLSGIFITSGYSAYAEPGGRPKALPKVGLPESQELVKLNGAAMAGAGVMLGLGIFPKLAALILIGSLIPTTLAGHAFWNETDPKARTTQQVQFFKNLGLLGGLLMVLTDKKKKRKA
ncbi:MAG: hypothetical protein JWP00_364 [Chloroflexi bacterium]|jgi:putative oxidoreductase|nr:hypothetical protein [Chloroflexota bacterium]